MKEITVESVDHAIKRAARSFSYLGWDITKTRLTEDTTSPDFGKTMLEDSFLITIRDPRNRLTYCKPVDVSNMVGLWIYLMSGSEDVQPIEFYNPVARRFVDEGVNPVRLRATWGNRLFASGAVERCISLLISSPESRRAIIPVLSLEDVGYSSRNLPCLASIQFAYQEGQLNCYVTMRSQAAMGVMPYDLFLLTMLHEWVAMRAKLPLGTYTHFAPLCGIRQSEVEWLKPTYESEATSEPMPRMEDLDPGKLALFHYCERIIRLRRRWPNEIASLPLYWQGFLIITAQRAGLSVLPPEFPFPVSFVERISSWPQK